MNGPALTREALENLWRDRLQESQRRYQIAKATRIDESALAKFYNGQRGLSTKALDRLGEHLELVITTRRKPRKSKGR